MAWSAGAILTAAQLNTYVPQTWSTWTPTITASSGTFTTVSGSGRYILMGKTFVWSAFLLITTVGSASGSVLFTLPITARVATDDYIGNGRQTSAGNALQVYLNTATQGGVLKYDNTSAIAATSLILSGVIETA